jgi:hypothetical protein
MKRNKLGNQTITGCRKKSLRDHKKTYLFKVESGYFNYGRFFNDLESNEAKKC